MHVARFARLAVVGALALSPALLPAQGTGPRTVRVGLTAGATLPIGDFGDIAALGFNVGGLVEFQPVNMPVGLRLEGVYHRNEIDFDALPGLDVDGNTRILAFTGNAILPLGAGTETASPYLIGGVGIYNLKGEGSISFGGVTDSESDSETKFGLNGGAGVRLPLSGFTASIEARFHTVFTSESNTNFIPFSFNIVF
jgi:opacity protein-like surface antigen